MKAHPVDTWFVAKSLTDASALDELLAEDATFISPLTGVAQAGKKAVKLQVSGIMKVLADGEHRYIRQIVGTNDAMLEFESVKDGLKINGVEILRWNNEGRITEIKVMLRPLDSAVVARDRMEQLLLTRKRAQ